MKSTRKPKSKLVGKTAEKTARKTTGKKAILVTISAFGITAILLLIKLWSNGWEVSAQCRASVERLSNMNVEQISLLNDAGKIIKFQSYIADDNNERADGYQHICEDVINKTHILFVFPQPIKGRFHMKNVKAALDIGFFDSAGRLISTMVMDTYDDGNSRLYHPGQRFQYALESRVGFFSEHQLSVDKARLVISSVND